MKEITTESIRSEAIHLGEHARDFEMYDGLITPVSDDVIVLSDFHKTQIELFAASAAMMYGDAEFNREPTRANSLGMPSLVARVDCTLEKGGIVPYELEDSPSGQGISDKLTHMVAGTSLKKSILDHYEEHLDGQIPHIHVSNHRSHGTDDALIVGDENYSFGDRNSLLMLHMEKPLVVKAIPGEADSHIPYIDMQHRLIAPLVSEGDKSYLERLRIANPVSITADLLRDESDKLVSQVVKKRLGSMAMGVLVHLSPEDRKRYGKHGTVTAERLVRSTDSIVKESPDNLLVQRFVPGIQLENKPGYNNAILRIFTLLSRDTSTRMIKAKAIGGCYVARKELVVHGARNSVSGAVVIE